jgi:hypothetical protein
MTLIARSVEARVDEVLFAGGAAAIAGEDFKI